MIVWSRWGILVLPFIGLGVGLGFLLNALTFRTDSGPSVPLCIGVGLLISAAGFLFFERGVIAKHLDKATPAFFIEQLPQPYVHPNGFRQTHRQVPVLHPQTGQQIWNKPRSTFFFAPTKYWPAVLGVLGVLLLLGGTIGVLVG